MSVFADTGRVRVAFRRLRRGPGPIKARLRFELRIGGQTTDGRVGGRLHPVPELYHHVLRRDRLATGRDNARVRLRQPLGAQQGLERLHVDDALFDQRAEEMPAGRVGLDPIATRADLAASLEHVAADAAVDVRVRRGDGTQQLAFVPFPGQVEAADRPVDASLIRPGRVVDIYKQFGLVFAGYPLETLPGNHLGQTPFAVRLPRGSYLFVLRREGSLDVRCPVFVPSKVERVHAPLLAPTEIPPGFVYVAGGTVTVGGDPQSYNGLEEARVEVGGFLLSRLEVSFGEWLEFVRDPAVSVRIDAAGNAAVLADWDSPEIAALLTPALIAERRVPLVPVFNNQLAFVRGEGGWESRLPLEWPLFGVPILAAFEYTHWLDERNGGRWRFRLPRDVEWEKAARGADRRVFVWGDYFLWSFCRSQKGSYPFEPRRSVDRVGIYPFDESVYGVRDLAGSMKEPTSDADSEYRFSIVRGGEWSTPDLRDFRIATRNRRRPESQANFIGLRIAADLPAR